MELHLSVHAHEKTSISFKTLYTNSFTLGCDTLGLCLPASCASNNLSFILERIFRDKTIDNSYFTDFKLIQLKDLKDDNEWLMSAALLFIWYEKHYDNYLTICVCKHIYHSTT